MSREDTYPRIWAVVERIPRGRVATYGQVAALAGFAQQPRLAGYALHQIPQDRKLPWHRVINAQGKISLPADGEAHHRQRELLESEGVCFVGGHVDLARYRWQPRGRAPADAPVID